MGEGGAYSRGGTCFKFRLIEGALIQRGCLFDRGGGANLKIYGVQEIQKRIGTFISKTNEQVICIT